MDSPYKHLRKPRRETDLNILDIEIILTLLNKRIHTLNTHLSRSQTVDGSDIVKSMEQLYITVDKLNSLKERITSP